MKTILPLMLVVTILSMSSAEPVAAQNLADVLSELESRVEKIEQQSGENLIPTGAIVMWSGAINDIPQGWVLCDGTKGTPNLNDRFVMGTATTESNALRTGGGDVVLLNENLPLHLHSIEHGHGHTLSVSPVTHNHKYGRTRTDIVGSHYERNSLKEGGDRGLWTGDSVSTDAAKLVIAGRVSGFVGESTSSGMEAPTPIKIIPSFYKLAFIMKVSE